MLNERITQDIKSAMKAKDKTTLTTLRSLKTAITNFEKLGKEIDDEVVMGQIKKQIKQRNDSIEAFSKAGKTDLAEKEQSEIEVLKSYLPKQLSLEEVKSIVSEKVSSFDSPTMRDMGKIIKACSEEIKGRADNSLVAKLVKEKISG